MIVLDTHAWIWWVSSPEKLSRQARAAIDTESQLAVAAISSWEVAMLVAGGRLELDRDELAWIRQALALPRIELAPLEPSIAVRAARLEDFHGDPADRMIVATALERRAAIVSSDRRIRSYRPVRAVW